MLNGILGKIFGKGSATALDGIGGLIDKFVRTKDEKAEFEKELTEILIKAESEDQKNVTERWRFDMSSDSKLSKSIRPIALAFLTFMLIVIIILSSSVEGFVVEKEWISLLQVLLLTVYGAYFGGRTIEKFKQNQR